MDDIAIECRHIYKQYNLCRSPSEQLLHLIGVKKDKHIHNALSDISFQVRKGEILGIIGMNGSGKSTLSRIIAGISTQTSGEVYCSGYTNMLSASTGLNFYMNGLENIRYKCILMGIEKREIERLIPKIVDFLI